MAYKTALDITLTTDKPKVVYQHIRDFLTGTGLYNSTTGIGEWTVTNFFEATPGVITDNDWFLIKTTGETGAWDFRVLVKVTSLGIISWSGFNWGSLTTVNPTVTTRVGLSTECIATPANWTALYLYADKNFCAVVIRAGTTNYVHRFGICDMVYPASTNPVGILSNTSSGSNINVSLADSSPSQFDVGKRITFFDYNQSSSETSQITANNTGTDIITVNVNTYQYFSATTKVNPFFPYVLDNVLSKSLSSTCTTFVLLTVDGQGPNSAGGYLYSVASYDGITPNPFTMQFVAHRVLYSPANSGGTVFAMPSWHLVTKKRSTEAEAHTDGTNNWRYFSYFNDTSTMGFLFKE